MYRYKFENEEYAFWPDVEDLINDTIKRLKHCSLTTHLAAAIDWLENAKIDESAKLKERAKNIEEELPDLTGRWAKCPYCNETRKSSFDLPFFEYQGLGSYIAENQCHICGYFTKGKELVKSKYCYNKSDKPIPNVCINKDKECFYAPYEYDKFYCGCRGWD